MDLTNTKVVIFDLDGTLYDDTRHFDYYAEQLEGRLPNSLQQRYATDYEAARADEHTLRVGRVYDIEKDLILSQMDDIVQQAFRWDGTQLSGDDTRAIYGEPLVYDKKRFINIGDLWWIPGSIALHYGLTLAQIREGFLETRSYMMRPDFYMKPVPGLTEALNMLKDRKKLVMLTNSPKPDSEVILQKLGIDRVFHLKIFEARKPVETEAHLHRVSQAFDARPEEILSIGDNWLNEIRPAKKLGCKTIYIDPHELGNPESADLVVANAAAVAVLLSNL